MVAVPGVQAPLLLTLYLSIPYFRRDYTLDPFRVSKAFTSANLHLLGQASEEAIRQLA